MIWRNKLTPLLPIESLKIKVKYKKVWCLSCKMSSNNTIKWKTLPSKRNCNKKQHFLIFRLNSEKDSPRILLPNIGNFTMPTKQHLQPWCCWSNQPITILIDKLKRYRVGAGSKTRSVSICVFFHNWWKSH